MANTFKNEVFAGGNTAANTDIIVYTCPSSTTTVVIGLSVANLATSQITADIKLNAGTTVHLVKNLPIPTASSFEFMAGNKVITFFFIIKHLHDLLQMLLINIFFGYF